MPSRCEPAEPQTTGPVAAVDAARRVVVLGIGNTILSDEGVGVHALAALQQDFELPPGTEVIDGGTAGMELLDALTDVDLLLVFDAVKAGRAPGSLVCLEGDEVPVFFRHKLSPHQVGIGDVLASLRFAGNGPRDLVLVGVEPAVLDLGLSLSAAVAASLPRMIAAAAEQLRRRGIELRPRERAKA